MMALWRVKKNERKENKSRESTWKLPVVSELFCFGSAAERPGRGACGLYIRVQQSGVSRLL